MHRWEVLQGDLQAAVYCAAVPFGFSVLGTFNGGSAGCSSGQNSRF